MNEFSTDQFCVSVSKMGEDDRVPLTEKAHMKMQAALARCIKDTGAGGDNHIKFALFDSCIDGSHTMMLKKFFDCQKETTVKDWMETEIILSIWNEAHTETNVLIVDLIGGAFNGGPARVIKPCVKTPTGKPHVKTSAAEPRVKTPTAEPCVKTDVKFQTPPKDDSGFETEGEMPKVITRSPFSSLSDDDNNWAH